MNDTLFRYITNVNPLFINYNFNQNDKSKKR